MDIVQFNEDAGYDTDENVDKEGEVESGDSSKLFDVSKFKSIKFNTLKDRYDTLIEMAIKNLDTYGLVGSDPFFKIELEIEDGKIIDLVIQKFDSYMLGVVRNKVVYEYVTKNSTRKFKGSVTLGFGESHPTLEGLKMGLKWFKDAVRNILRNKDYRYWQNDLTLLTVIICEGLRFHPLFNRVFQFMRDQVQIPWLLPHPFPTMIRSWSKLCKFLCGAVKNEAYRPPKLKGMSIKTFKELLESKEATQFAFYAIKWSHLRSKQIGFTKNKGDWEFKPPTESSSSSAAAAAVTESESESESESSSSGQNVPTTATPEVDPEDHRLLGQSVSSQVACALVLTSAAQPAMAGQTSMAMSPPQSSY